MGIVRGCLPWLLFKVWPALRFLPRLKSTRPPSLSAKMPATRRITLLAIERSSSESSLYTNTNSGTSYTGTDSDASSSSPAPTPALALRQRRTRKRISQAQLVALENLFARSSHPSQQDRDVLAKAINMYVGLLPFPIMPVVEIVLFSFLPSVRNALLKTAKLTSGSFF